MADDIALYWNHVAADLGIRIISPFELVLPSARSVLASALVRDFGTREGMLIVESFAMIGGCQDELLESGFGYSVLESGRSVAAYDRESLVEMLCDWTWTGNESRKPDWLKACV